MTKDYQQLWEGVINAANETEAVQTLAEIVADSDGRAFVLDLESEYVALCIETLDHVSCDPHLPPPPPHTNSSGHRSAQSRNNQEGGFFPHVKETC